MSNEELFNIFKKIKNEENDQIKKEMIDKLTKEEFVSYLRYNYGNENINYEINNKGNYIIKDGDRYILEFSENASLSNVYNHIEENNDIVNELSNKSSYQVIDVNKLTTNRSVTNGQNYTIKIDTELFDEILKIYNKIYDDLKVWKRFAKSSNLTGELRDYYNNVIGNNDIEKIIDEMISDFEDIVLKIEASINTYEEIDKSLYYSLNSLITEIFSLDSSMVNIEGSTYEDRRIYIDETIKNLVHTLNVLEGEYEELYGEGIPIDGQKAIGFVNLLSSLGLFSLENGDIENYSEGESNVYTLYNKETGCFDIKQLGYVLNYCKERDIFPSIKKYVVEGEDWCSSGMDSLFGERLIKQTAYVVGPYHISFKQIEPYEGEYSGWCVFNENGNVICDAESVFLSNYTCSYINENGDIEEDFYRDIEAINANLGNAYAPIDGKNGKRYYAHEFENGRYTVNWAFGMSGTNYGQPFYHLMTLENKEYVSTVIKEHIKVNDVFSMVEEDNDKDTKNIYELYNEAVIMESDIMKMSQSIYQYRLYYNLMPYEEKRKNKDFNAYLNKDYSNYSNKVFESGEYKDWLKYMDRSEVVLFEYLMNTEGESSAKNYLNILEDTVNQRIGYMNAVSFVENLNEEDTYTLSDIFTLPPVFYFLSQLEPNAYDTIEDFSTSATTGLGDGLYNYGNGWYDLVTADGIRSAKDYEFMYKMQLLSTNNEYNMNLSSTERTFLKGVYEVGNSLGYMTVPTLLSYIPVVGKPLSTVSLLGSSSGNNTEDLMQQGVNRSDAYLYGSLMGLSETAIEMICGGLPGSKDVATKGFTSLVKSSLEEAGEEFVQTYLSSGIASCATGEPVDLSNLTGEALHSAFMAIFTSAAMNVGGKAYIKVADTIIEVSPSDYNSYEEWFNSVESKYRESHPYLSSLFMGKSDDNNQEMLLDVNINNIPNLTNEQKSLISSLKYNSETNTYDVTLMNGKSFVINDIKEINNDKLIKNFVAADMHKLVDERKERNEILKEEVLKDDTSDVETKISEGIESVSTGYTQVKNLWDTKAANKFVYLNTIAEVVKAIKDGKIDYSFKVMDHYNKLIGKPSTFLEEIIAENDMEMKLTDENHQVIYDTSSSFTKPIFSPEFFNKFKEEITNAFAERILEDDFIHINENLFNDKIFDTILGKEERTVFLHNITLTDEQIKALQENFIQAYVDDKKVSSKCAIGVYTRTELKDKSRLSLYYDEISSTNINNFKYLPDNCVIDFNDYDTNIPVDRQYVILNDFLTGLNTLEKPFKVNIDVRKRSLIEKSGLLKHDYNNLELSFSDVLEKYTREEYLEEDRKLNDLVKDIKDADLSPYEKYIAVYNIVKKYKPYKESDNKEESRFLKYILDNEYMVCVGYSNLLEALLGKVGIDSVEMGVAVDSSYDAGFTQEEKVVKREGHSRLLVNIDDDKYGIHGIYVADPTWDNILEKDLFNYSLMTIDQMQTNKRMFWNDNTNIMLDVHNFSEFTDHMNYIFKKIFDKKLKSNKTSLFPSSTEKVILDSYEEMVSEMKKSLQYLDTNKWNEIYSKYKFETESEYADFLTEIGHFIVDRVNKPIASNIPLDANLVVKSVLDGLNKKEIRALRNETNKTHYQRENNAFPYYLTEDGYLGEKINIDSVTQVSTRLVDVMQKFSNLSEKVKTMSGTIIEGIGSAVNVKFSEIMNIIKQHSIEFRNKKYLDVSLSEIDFSNMNIEDITYILNNNKVGGQLTTNPSNKYITSLCMENIDLAKLWLKNNQTFNNETSFNILDYVLKNDPKFEIDISNIDSTSKINIIQKYLSIGNSDFVSKNINYILPTEFLQTYRYDTNKTILDVMLEYDIKFNDVIYSVLLENEEFVVKILNNDKYLNEILSNDNYNEVFFGTLSKIEDGKMLFNYVNENFDVLKSNPYVLKLAKENDGIASLFINNGIFEPLLEDPFRKMYGTNNTILDYFMHMYNNGQKTDVGIDYFDDLLVSSSENSSYYWYMIAETYVKNNRIEPLSKLHPKYLISYMGDYTILDYILKSNPSFKIDITKIEYRSNLFNIFESYLKIGNSQFIQENLMYLKPNELLYSQNNKMLLDILLDNNITIPNEFKEELINNPNVIRSFIEHKVYLEDIIKLPEYILLEKVNNDSNVTILEKILSIDKTLVSSLGKGPFSPEMALILVKYGVNDIELNTYLSRTSEVMKKISEYFNDNIEFQTVLTQEQQSVFNEFMDKFCRDGDYDANYTIALGFYNMLLNNPQEASNYLAEFISVKENNPGFQMYFDSLKGAMCSSANSIVKSVSIRDNNLFVLNHEIAHAIHKTVDQYKYPDHIKVLVEAAAKNPETLKKVNEFGEMVHQKVLEIKEKAKREFHKYLEQNYQDGENGYREALKIEFDGILKNPLIFLDTATNTYAIKIIENIQDISFDVYYQMTYLDDLNAFAKKAYTKELEGYFMLENLMDAIYEGRWLSAFSEFTSKCYNGHGTSYFEQSIDSAFSEIIANVIGIQKTNPALLNEMRNLLNNDQLYNELISYSNWLSQKLLEGQDNKLNGGPNENILETDVEYLDTSSNDDNVRYDSIDTLDEKVDIPRDKYLDISLSQIDFSNMSIDDITYIIKNNKVGGDLLDNPSSNYIVGLAKQNVELAKLWLENDKYFASKNSMEILDYVLSIDPKYEVELSNLLMSYEANDILIKYMDKGNWDYIARNINYLELSLIFDMNEQQSILDKLMENNLYTSKPQCLWYSKYAHYCADKGLYLENLILLPENLLLQQDKSGISLLDKILKKNKALGEIIVKKSFEGDRVNVKTAMILADYGYMALVVNNDLHTQQFKQYLDNLNLEKQLYVLQNSFVLTDEQDKLYKEFIRLYGDNTDKNIINMLTCQFYSYLINDPRSAVIFIENLIKLKEIDPNFELKYDNKKGSFYTPGPIFNYISINSYSLSSLVHELTHVFHNTFVNNEYPQHIKILIDNLKKDPNTLIRLQEYATRKDKEIISFKNKLLEHDVIDKKLDSIYPGGKVAYYEELRKEYEECMKDPDKLWSEVNNRTIANILDGTIYSIDEYRKLLNEKTITFEEYAFITTMNDYLILVKDTVKSKYTSVFTIENLMDAIYEGKWSDGELEGVNAKCYSGHTSSYYQKNSVFGEILANIGSLSSGSTNESDHNDLKYLLGEELYNALFNYYYNLEVK